MSLRLGLRVPVDRIEANEPWSPSTKSGRQPAPFEYCASERDHIRQSIVLILRTRPGTRPLLPEYGCRLHELLFRPNGPALRGQAAFFVAEALRLFEPRVEVRDVTVGWSDHRRGDPFTLRIRILYHLRELPGAGEAVTVEYADGIATLGPSGVRDT